MQSAPAPMISISEPLPEEAHTVFIPTQSSVLDVELVGAVAAAAGHGAPVILALDAPGTDDGTPPTRSLLTVDERAGMLAAVRAARAVVRAGSPEQAAQRFAKNRWIVPYREAAALAGAIDACARAGVPVRLGRAFPARDAASVIRRIAAGRPTPLPGAEPPSIAGVSDRILPADRLQQWLDTSRAAGSRIVTVNGCFDLLHPGHIRFLQGAAAMGDLLLALINSDASVRRYKGDDRPLLDAGARATVLAALVHVDRVVVFEADTPIEILDRIRPAVHCKGGSYEPDRVADEKRVVESHGGRVECLPMTGAYSSTDLAARVRRPR